MESPSKVMNTGEAASYLDPSSFPTKTSITDVTKAFTKFEKVWFSGKKISLSMKLKLYGAHVISVMLYNTRSTYIRCDIK